VLQVIYFYFHLFIHFLITIVIGYLLSLWTTLIAVSFNNTIFNSPKIIPTWILFYPTFNICRIIYLLTMKCAYEACVDSLFGMSEELQTCLIVLFISPWIYFILGMYFYEVNYLFIV